GVVLLADPELALGAEHAFGRDAADRRRADGATAGQHRARRRERGAHAARGVRRAADDAEALRPGAHTAHYEPMTVTLAELALDRLDLADDDAFQIGRDRRHARDLEARVHEPLARLLRRQ